MKHTVRQIYDLLTDSLYPLRCPVCDGVLAWDPGGLVRRAGAGTEEVQMNGNDGSGQDPGSAGSLICRGCLTKLSFVKPPLCSKCGKQLLLASQKLCADCSRLPRSFERGASVLNYEEHAQESMVKIKYGKRREYTKFYGRLMAERLGDEIRGMDPQCIIPVPVHPERFMERGYNQAELLAREVSRQMGIPLEKDILVRVRKTAVQKDLGAEERLKNLSEAFGVLYDEDSGCSQPVPYDRVLLVDDIFTTGSTIEACSRVLKAAGVKQVYFVTVCTGSDR